MRRREFLFGLAALARAGPPALATPRIALAASWQVASDYQVGVLQEGPTDALRMVCALDVPTRAHGLLREASGTVLAVARRPGDWLLRWDRTGRAIAWHWIEPRRAFSGHVLASPDGGTLYTTEIDLETGAGLIGVRDSASLEKRAEWHTHGIDAHELILDSTDSDRLFVANGGVATRPETGRVKRDLAHMDSSLVRLDADTGELLGQWRLDDRRLSLRHLAWNRAAGRAVLGIALQAEHDDPALKDLAPVLALFDGVSLRAASARASLAGYGGDIAVLGQSFAVSCPRAQGVALQDVDGAWRGLIPLAEACALVTNSGQIWAGGRHAAVTCSGNGGSGSLVASAMHPVPDVRLDNHWIAI